MTAQPIEANVVLTADNSGYDQSMAQSSQATSTLIDSVDKLTAKIGKLTKTAGKSLIGIAAADVAVITGATAAWSSYEKQVERLKSQSAVLGRSTDEPNKLMKAYGNTVKTLRSEMGTTTAEAAKLTETLTKVVQPRQTRDLNEMSKTFIQMSQGHRGELVRAGQLVDHPAEGHGHAGQRPGDPRSTRTPSPTWPRRPTPRPRA